MNSTSYDCIHQQLSQLPQLNGHKRMPGFFNARGAPAAWAARPARRPGTSRGQVNHSGPLKACTRRAFCLVF